MPSFAQQGQGQGLLQQQQPAASGGQPQWGSEQWAAMHKMARSIAPFPAWAQPPAQPTRTFTALKGAFSTLLSPMVHAATQPPPEQHDEPHLDIRLAESHPKALAALKI